MPDDLLAVLHAAARGEFPPPDGSVVVVEPPPGPAMAVLAFTAYWILATAAPESWVRAQLAPGDMHGPMSPRFLAALARRLVRRDDGLDVVLAATGLPGAPALAASAEKPSDPRRREVRTFTDQTGAARVTVGRGLALRAEVAIEVEPNARSRGWRGGR